MRVVVVPNELRDAIYSKLDAAMEGLIVTPEEREIHYNRLLDYYDQHGVIPDFKITKAESEEPK